MLAGKREFRKKGLTVVRREIRKDWKTMAGSEGYSGIPIEAIRRPFLTGRLAREVRAAAREVDPWLP